MEIDTPDTSTVTKDPDQFGVPTTCVFPDGSTKTFESRHTEKDLESHIEKTFGIEIYHQEEQELNHGGSLVEKEKLLSTIRQSVCSCKVLSERRAQRLKDSVPTEAFTVNPDPGVQCCICRNYLKEHCISCDPSENPTCRVVRGKCGHEFHHHCLSGWLKCRQYCPLDQQDWEYYAGETTTTTTTTADLGVNTLESPTVFHVFFGENKRYRFEWPSKLFPRPAASPAEKDKGATNDATEETKDNCETFHKEILTEIFRTVGILERDEALYRLSTESNPGQPLTSEFKGITLGQENFLGVCSIESHSSTEGCCKLRLVSNDPSHSPVPTAGKGKEKEVSLKYTSTISSLWDAVRSEWELDPSEYELVFEEVPLQGEYQTLTLFNIGVQREGSVIHLRPRKSIMFQLYFWWPDPDTPAPHKPLESFREFLTTAAAPNRDPRVDMDICCCPTEKVKERQDNERTVVVVPVPYHGTDVGQGGFQSMVSFRSAWRPFFASRHHPVTPRAMKVFLSCLYVLCQKVGKQEADISSAVARFESMLDLCRPTQKNHRLARELGLQGVRLLLEKRNGAFRDVHRIMVSTLMMQILDGVLPLEDGTGSDKWFEHMNVLCSHWMANPQEKQVQPMGWRWLVKQVRLVKTFQLVSPLNLGTRQSAPCLTLDQKGETCVYVGRGKDSSANTTLFLPLKNEEIAIDVPTLAKELSEKMTEQSQDLQEGGSMMTMVDDREWQEAIVVCMDLSLSMSTPSGFREDKESEKKDKQEMLRQVHALWDEMEVYTGPLSELHPGQRRSLQDAVVWFLTHENFPDFLRRHQRFRQSPDTVLADLVRFYQAQQPDVASQISKYRKWFSKLLQGETVVMGGGDAERVEYNYNRKATLGDVSMLIDNASRTEEEQQQDDCAPYEYKCPITQGLMKDPVIASDGVSYERSAIEAWFKRPSPATSPKKGTPVANKTLLPNDNLKILIAEWRDKWKETRDQQHPKSQDSSSTGPPATLKLTSENHEVIAEISRNRIENGWDIAWMLFKMQGWTRGDYSLSRSAFARLDMASTINAGITSLLCRRNGSDKNPNNNNNTDIKITVESPGWELSPSGVRKQYTVPSRSNTEYLMHRLAGEYDQNATEIVLWWGLTSGGDGYRTGEILAPNVMFRQLGDGEQQINLEYNVNFSPGRWLPDPSMRYQAEGRGRRLNRLETCKQCFNLFIDRSLAYDLPAQVGLVTFNDKVEMPCPISPYYELFREKIEEVQASGGTALFSAIERARDALVEWRDQVVGSHDSDQKQPHRNAKLRIVCLTDGKDMDSKGVVLWKLCQSLQKNNITLDCIQVGEEQDRDLIKLCRSTEGYAFVPKTLKQALDIVELETLIYSVDRDVTTRRTYVHSGFSWTSLQHSGQTPLDTDRNIVPRRVQPEQKMKSTSSCANDALRNADDLLAKLEQSARQKSAATTGETAGVTIGATIGAARVRRLQQELKYLVQNSHPSIDVYVNDADITFWKVVIEGPDGTPYAGGCWLAYMEFPEDYPMAPPVMRFHTPIRHCNINSYGRVCHSIFDRNYTPDTTVAVILQCVYGLLLNPDVTDPLDSNLALLYHDANGQYEASIMSYVSTHAKTPTRKGYAQECERAHNSV